MTDVKHDPKADVKHADPLMPEQNGTSGSRA